MGEILKIKQLTICQTFKVRFPSIPWSLIQQILCMQDLELGVGSEAVWVANARLGWAWKFDVRWCPISISIGRLS
jgi:hypothetical protein